MEIREKVDNKYYVIKTLENKGIYIYENEHLFFHSKLEKRLDKKELLEFLYKLIDLNRGLRIYDVKNQK